MSWTLTAYFNSQWQSGKLFCCFYFSKSSCWPFVPLYPFKCPLDEKYFNGNLQGVLAQSVQVGWALYKYVLGCMWVAIYPLHQTFSDASFLLFNVSFTLVLFHLLLCFALMLAMTLLVLLVKNSSSIFNWSLQSGGGSDKSSPIQYPRTMLFPILTSSLIF